MRMRTVTLMAALSFSGCASQGNRPAAESAPSAAQPSSPSLTSPGPLGEPWGSYLSLEGVAAEHGKVGHQTLLVESVNDRRLDPPVAVWIDNVRSLPRGVRCRVHGYESGRWIGVPPAVLAATGQPSPQALWQFQRYVIATSAEPADRIELTSRR